MNVARLLVASLFIGCIAVGFGEAILNPPVPTASAVDTSTSIYFTTSEWIIGTVRAGVTTSGGKTYYYEIHGTTTVMRLITLPETQTASGWWGLEYAVLSLGVVVLIVAVVVLLMRRMESARSRPGALPQTTTDTSRKEKASKFCRHCGTEIPQDSAFCESCGKKL